jgi:hypothetical protein
VPAAGGFIPGTYGLKISVTVAISVASSQERVNGKEKNSRQIPIIEQTRKRVSKSGNKKIQTIGNGIVGSIQSTVCITDKCNGYETEAGR